MPFFNVRQFDFKSFQVRGGEGVGKRVKFLSYTINILHVFLIPFQAPNQFRKYKKRAISNYLCYIRPSTSKSSFYDGVICSYVESPGTAATFGRC